MKDKILFVLKVPPPHTGATMMNKRTINSSYLKNKYNIKTIPISFSKTIKELGSISFTKVFLLIYYNTIYLIKVIFFNPKLIYLHLSPSGVPFIRDSMLIILAKVLRKKIVVHLRARGVAGYLKNKNTFIKKYYKLIFRSCEVICLTKGASIDIKEVYNKKPYILNNGIPALNYYENRKIKPQDSKIQILFLSNLIISKGILDFIESIKLLKHNNYDFIAYIVGADADYTNDDIRALIHKNNLEDCVRVTGPLYDKEKENILKSTDIMVFPTYFPIETFGSVIIEAMQFEIPVISTNFCGIPEIISDNKDGFLVNIKSPNEIFKKLSFLLENPEVRLNMAKNAREKFLSKYTFSHYEKNIESIFNDIILSK